MMIPWEYVNRPITYVSFPSESTIESTLHSLPDEYRKILSKAITNVLATDLAERVYAEILDGLPSVDSVDLNKESGKAFSPALELHKDGICPGFIDKARHLRHELDLSTLSFNVQALKAFTEASFSSEHFHLRLIELVVVACHRIGAKCFELDDGAHKHQIYDDWRNNFLYQKTIDEALARRKDPAPTAFAHSFYCDYEKYPRGLADVVGYWAESMIFGGVVVFDRGSSETECKSMWLHDQRGHTPGTLYPPTTEQFSSLINFLLSSPGEDHQPECPLPINPTTDNRPRWHPWHAFARYHISRDRYERKVSAEEPQFVKYNFKDWPELQEQSMIEMEDCSVLPEGWEELAAKARERSLDYATWMTPSSPARRHGKGQGPVGLG